MFNKEKHPLFLSMEEAKLREKFLADVESKLPLYLWRFYNKGDDVRIVTLDVPSQQVISDEIMKIK